MQSYEEIVTSFREPCLRQTEFITFACVSEGREFRRAIGWNRGGASERRPPRYKVAQKTAGGGGSVGDGVAESHEVPVETRGASQRRSFVQYARLRRHEGTACSEAARRSSRRGNLNSGMR